MFRAPRTLAPGRRSSVGAALALLMLAACTHVSLKEQPQVLDWSNNGQATVTQAQGASPPAFYTVRRDDTLATIASRFGTTPSALAAWNNLAPSARLRPDQVLRVSSPTAVGDAASPVATPQPIGDSAIEARPIGAGSSSTPLVPSPSPASSNAPQKTGPLGLKRPYSDATLAELSKTDGDTVVASIAPSPSPPAPPVAPPSADPAAVGWAWPVAGSTAGRFDEKAKGVDLVGKAGDPVLAAADGRVTFAGTGVRGYGNFVIVQHSPELLSVYAHNRANLVKEGATVTKGQKIAEMGATDADGVKLHFEIRRDSKPVDPLQYLPPR